jgi:hypothetical protein
VIAVAALVIVGVPRMLRKWGGPPCPPPKRAPRWPGDRSASRDIGRADILHGHIVVVLCILFKRLNSRLDGASGKLSYAQIGAALDLAEGTVRVMAHRIRKRLRAIIHEEIARTVAAPDQIEPEIEQLFVALRA